MDAMWTWWLPNPHLFSNRGETIQPLFWPNESTAIAIAAGVLQAAELEPLQWLLPEEGVLPGVKILCSKKRQIISESERANLLTQITSDNRKLNATTARETISRKQIDFFLIFLSPKASLE